MNRELEAEQDYLGFRIKLRGGPDSTSFGFTAAAQIEDARQQVICTFFEKLDMASNDDVAAQRVIERALHRARGAILLDRVQDLDGRQFWASDTPHLAHRSDEYLRALILDAFKRGFRHKPALGGRIQFDDIGVALVEEVDQRNVEYCLERLVLDGLIKSWASGHGPGARLFMPTAAGLAEADRLSVPSRAPGFLLEETVAKVESCLNRYEPELVDSLRRQSVRIAETKELGEHEVGEIAQACEQVIWDFLDLDVLWEGVKGDRPPRDKTRDRVRLLLRGRATSDTESALMEGLESYLVGWFGPLQEFIHKHRHLPGEPDRRQAKRCIIYTYLLLADLSELLSL